MFVELTGTNGNQIMVNLSRAICFWYEEGSTKIVFSNSQIEDFIYVKESYEQVKSLVMEEKLNVK